VSAGDGQDEDQKCGADAGEGFQAMNSTGHFEEEDLALYAMHLLAEPEASAVARYVAESEEARRQLADVRASLAAYAKATVELQAPPNGSLDRLMGRIAQEQKTIAMPVTVPARTAVRAESRGLPGKVLPWIGWAVAAGMTVAAGKLYQDRATLHRMLTAQAGQVTHLSADARVVYRERDTLKTDVAEQAKELEALRMEATRAKSETANLRTTAAGQTAKLNEETAKSGEQTEIAANAMRERDVLRGTVAAQADQMARLTTDATKARQVLEALTDRGALRVTLTKPKTSAAPTGRATYVASRGTLVFLASNLAPLKPDKVYQLWIMPADGSNPVPAGTFAPDERGNASVVYGQFPRAVPAKGFAVTIENEGGSQTPTLPIILAG